VEDLKGRISELAALMDEFRLGEAELKDEDYRVAFRRRPMPIARPAGSETSESTADQEFVEPEPIAPIEVKPSGTPVNSPMTGIYYAAPSPTASPFVKEGEHVTAGQVVGLIEAMKVFNEITAPTSGTVLQLVAQSGQLVQPGDPLLYIG
jgi:acetyl-CoA carboxylase biotin carboxyl carrier protein